MVTPDLGEGLLELIRRSATDLPEDVEAALRRGREREVEGSAARSALDTILANVALARAESTALCQDTGTPIFQIRHPLGWSQRALARQVETAIAEATRRAWLRPNAVDPLSGRNTGTNVGDGRPALHFEEWDGPGARVDLLLKGGGCENVSRQYTLPDADLGAARDLEGVRRVVLDAAFRAQGKGCAPGVLGVAIGGDRALSHARAKEQLLRPLDEPSPSPVLAELEQRLTDEVNRLDVGPMGFGGRTTVLAVKASAPHRHPASFYVTVAYMCWADRRRSLHWRDGAFSIV